MKKRQNSIRSYGLIILFFLGLFVSGCAHVLPVPESEISENYIRKAAAYEKEGNLVAARKMLALALTVDPQNKAALQKQEQIRTEMDRKAEEYFQSGLQFNRYGKYNRAQHAFLNALRLRPDHPEAVTMLTERKRIQAEKYVVHTIAPGESLSKLAKLYYGDHRKFPLIARYNELPDATTVRIGQAIRIPLLKDVKLLSGEDALVTEEEADSGVGPEEEIDQVAIYRDHGIDLYNQKEYEEALVEFEKVLGARPDDQSAIDYSFESHFQIAKIHFEKKRYLEAIDGFRSCLDFRKDCRQCRQYLAECEDAYKEIHYRKGMEFFDRENLSEAIREWELIQARDPQYKRVDYLINKARKIQSSVKELKGGKQ